MRILTLLGALLIGFTLQAQKQSKSAATVQYDEKLYSSLQWRNIGPHIGGRSAAVTGVPGKPNLYYMGATGGGVWRTTDGGNSWENISDGFFGGSIGAVAVSEYDNNVIYVGGGEKTMRGNVSYGYGMYKSLDAGKTWNHIGLEDAMHIPRVRIHPKNPDLVYVAVLGDLYKSSETRGVYRSKDGGKTWERVLFANKDAGAVDLILDPNNPRILYATTWRVRRNPYNLSSGGEGSAIWKSTDGGDTWQNISKAKGLPEGTWGIIGITVSPVNSNRVWAIIEADKGGVYRSDDGGTTWAKLNDDRNLRQRAWYYTRIYADTKDEDGVYVVNVAYHKSKDGGKTFQGAYAEHGDHHDLWIAPEDNQRMIIADDGGAQISFDGGENWSVYTNQPTGQFYRVTTDNTFPYRIYGAQQDNNAIRVPHRTDGGAITNADVEETAGSESAHIAVDPTNDEIVYGGSYGGFMSRINHATGEMQAVNVWPDNPMGHGAEGTKYRFQWNYPIFFSPHGGNKLYAASNHLHLSTDGGKSWKTISPDLTRNDPSTLGPSGGPITKDNTSVEYYGTIFAATESALEPGLIWAASDDGLIHVSKNNGENWENVTPKGIPEWMMFNSVEVHPTQKGGLYVAGTRYKSGDYQPYLYKTSDYGKTWTKITNGIDATHFTRVVRADPKRARLLYAGTESGMYVSFDDGASWKPFQLNLPIVPITDLTIKNDNLIAATQGRGFWLIDDLTVMHQLANQSLSSAHLYKPLASYRMNGGDSRDKKREGQNLANGVIVHYYLPQAPDTATTISLEFMEMDGTLIKKYSNKAEKPNEQLGELKAGGNTFVWNTRYPDAKSFDGMILWWSQMAGPKSVPGTYKVKMTVNGQAQEQTFEILKDPRSSATQEDMQKQFDYMLAVSQKVTEAHEAIESMRKVKAQVSQLSERLKDKEDMKDLVEKGKEINKQLTAVEEALYQTKNRSGQDPLNYPIRLTNKLAHLNSLTGMGDAAPTEQAEAYRKEVTALIDAELAKYKAVMETEIPAFNQLAKEKALEALLVD
ncbi:glycosyl hydrolase [Cytophagales bacterium LB-30]|uniref:Glycosyl hydrolase n=1 Tax=Shiella aurantiaca TaxID=3058365 RepID=A0ABT8F6U1_9BACT|nr:glycosyl hydrolase [Shiella aurantiaca]MDN4166216.1 glycosyl hydrolase [Shiella aurantiaca]